MFSCKGMRIGSAMSSSFSILGPSFLSSQNTIFMKNQLIATIVAGIILFVWQFLSWSVLNIHGAEFQYTENQGVIMEGLSANLTNEGTYFMPQADPGSTDEEREELMKELTGQPWATVSYHKSMSTDTTMSMVRGILVDLAAAFLLIWLLGKIGGLDFKTALLGSLAVGAIGYLTITYMNGIWFEANTWGHLIDTFAQWGLVGVWLGWWMTRK
jgi:hypothetical protein